MNHTKKIVVSDLEKGFQYNPKDLFASPPFPEIGTLPDTVNFDLSALTIFDA